MGRGVVRKNSVADQLPNTFQILQNVVIPKSRNPVAAHFKPPCASAVSNYYAVICMLAAMYLDNQFRSRTEKVDHARANRLLAPKRNALHLLAPQD